MPWHINKIDFLKFCPVVLKFSAATRWGAFLGSDTQSMQQTYGAEHRVGGEVVFIPAVLPHHRTNGSVSGGL